MSDMDVSYKSEVEHFVNLSGFSTALSKSAVDVLNEISIQEMKFLLAHSKRVLTASSTSYLDLITILYLLRKNVPKFARLRRHLCFKDSQNKLISESSDMSNEEGREVTGERKAGSREQVFLQFAKRFILSNQLTEEYASHSNHNDAIKRMRLLREDRYLANMTSEAYVAFSSLRQSNYSSLQAKLRNWFQCEQINLHQYALEAVTFLFSEMMFDILDRVYLNRELSKKDSSNIRGFVFSESMPESVERLAPPPISTSELQRALNEKYMKTSLVDILEYRTSNGIFPIEKMFLL